MLAVFLTPLTLLALSVADHPCAAGTIDPRELTARKDFAAGRYDQSAEIFAGLFAETGDPVFLRNIARCYQKLRRPDEAITNFREYLTKGNISPAERTEIESYVEEMEILKRERAQATSVAPPPTATIPPEEAFSAPPAVAPAPVATRAVEPVPVVNATETRPTADPGRNWRIAGITTVAAGAALVVTGVVLGLTARAAADDVAHQWDPDRDSTGRRDENLQWIAYGLGAAAVATGGWLFLHGSEREARPSQVRVDAALWPPALRVGGRF